MIKKRILGIMTVLLLGLAGCAGTAEPHTAGETEAAAESESQTETAGEGEAANQLGGGSPWLDTNLKENIEEGMEPSLKDDFHLYVNYEWLLNNDIPDGYRSNGPFLDVERETTEKAKALLEDETLESHEARLVQQLYRAWMDWDSRNEVGLDPMISVLEALDGADSLDELTALLCDDEFRNSMPAFAGFGNTADFMDSSVYITEIGKSPFILSDAAEYENRTELGERYYEAYKHEAEVLLVRAGYDEKKAEEMFDSAISFETSLAEVSLTSEEYMSPDIYEKIYNVYALEELDGLSPAFPLRRMAESAGFGNSDRYLIEEPAYFERLNELYTQENLESMKDYMRVRCVLSLAQYLDRDAWELFVETQNAAGGSQGSLPDEEYDFQIVKNFLTEPLAKAYLERYDAAEKKEEITRICQEVIAAYREMLQGEEWLSESTREKAVEKLDNIQIKAVYPDQWYDYSGLSLEGLSYWECVNKIIDFSTERDWSRTNQKVDPNEWDVDILESNAYYNPQDNSINILLGILGGEFYGDDMTEEEIYGSIGLVIGHEISHAFDTNGAQFDKDGNLSNWWTEEDLRAFQERADRLIAYYDEIIPFSGQKVRGANIRTEAIADMGGFKCMLSIAEQKPDFNYDQFFRQFATIWRRLSSYEFEMLCLTQDTHPLHYLRTNVTLQQFEKFYETYDIQPGDGMYLAPEDRIGVW